MNPVFKSRFASTLVYVAVVVIILGFMLPLVWTFMTSLKDNVDSWSLPPQYVFTPKVDNYKAVIFEKHFLDYAVNSGIVAVCSTIISLILGTLTAYGLDRYAFKGSNLVFFFFFWVYMVPATIIALPLFLVAVELGLVDTHIMLIIAHSTFNTAFATWMMKGFLQEVPRDIEESAMIDGSSAVDNFSRSLRLSYSSTLSCPQSCTTISNTGPASLGKATGTSSPSRCSFLASKTFGRTSSRKCP